MVISSVEMSRLTGIGSGRLRTWERRHGFPTPVRAANNVRRYLASDVRRVLAVARLVEAGLPLAEAIQARPEEGSVPTPAGSLGAALDEAPAAAIALSGPAPLTVAWVNTATMKAPEAIQVGEDLLEVLPEFGPKAVSTIQQLMVGTRAQSAVVEHLDWVGTFPTVRRSVAWRIAPHANCETSVVLMQLEEGSDLEAGLELVSQQATWTAAIRAGGETLRAHGGITSVQRAIAQVVSKTGAIDGFLATCRDDGLRSASSVRGTFCASTIAVRPDGPLMITLRCAELHWLDRDERAAFGAPTRSRMLSVPMIAGGAALGGLFLVFPEELALDDASTELLRVFGTSLAITLQREHLTQRVEEVAA